MSNCSRLTCGMPAPRVVGAALIASLLVLSPAVAGAATKKKAATQNLVVGVTTDPNTLFPWKATQFQAVNLLQNVYGTLTEFDQDLNVVPGLAQSWTASPDGLTVTLTLRPKVTFTDRSTFGSEDVKSSLDRIRDQATAAVARSSLASVVSVDAPDARTVVLHLANPDSALLASLAAVNLAMLSSTDTEETLNTKPNGTGPFSVKGRVPAQSVTLSRNVRYWGKPAALNSIEFRVIPDPSSIASAVQSGNVQLAVFDDPLVARAAQGGSVSIAKTPLLAYHVLQLSARNGDLTDLNVRLAVQCAVDRKQVLDTAALGEGAVTGPITSPAYRSNPNNRPCPQRDLARAADYLKAAGKSAGVTIKTIVSQGEYSTSVNEAQNLKAQLAEAKITLDLEVLESGAYVTRWIAGDFEAAVALNGGRPDPDGMYGRYFTSTGNLNKVAGYSSPELDSLFEAGKAISEVGARKVIYAKISSVLEKNAVWIWMFTSYSYTATSSSVKGFVPMANGSLQYLRTTSVTN